MRTNNRMIRLLPEHDAHRINGPTVPDVTIPTSASSKEKQNNNFVAMHNHNNL